MTIIPFSKLSSSQFLFCHTEIIYEVSLWMVLGTSSEYPEGHRWVGEQISDYTLGKRKHIMTQTHFVLRLQSPASQSLLLGILTPQNRKWRHSMFNKRIKPLGQKNLYFALKTLLRFSLLYKSHQQLHQFCLPLVPTPHLWSWQNLVPSLCSLLTHVHNIRIDPNKITVDKRPVATLGILEESVA